MREGASAPNALSAACRTGETAAAMAFGPPGNDGRDGWPPTPKAGRPPHMQPGLRTSNGHRHPDDPPPHQRPAHAPANGRPVRPNGHAAPNGFPPNPGAYRAGG